MENKRKLFLILFISIFLLGIASRLFVFIIAYLKLPISTDEGIMGLMAMHVLKGEFPIVFWGQPYMGTQEAYFDTPLIFLFGPTTLTIRITTLLCSILFMYLVYRLASKIYNTEVGLLSLLLLSIPPPYLLMVSYYPPSNNLITIVLGTLALLITYDLVFNKENKGQMFLYALLGFILGFGFWEDMLIVSYIATIILLLFLKDKLLIIRRNLWILLTMFFISSFPIYWYNIKNDFVTFRVITSGVGKLKIIENLGIFFRDTIHFIIGTRVMFYCDTIHFASLPKVLTYSLLLILIAVITLVLIIKFKNIWRVSYLSLKNSDGTIMLLIMTLATILAFCRTGRSHWWAPRYLLPLMTTLPVIIAYGLWRIKRFAKSAFYICISIIFLANIWGTFLLVKAWSDPVLVTEKLELPDTKGLIEFLKEKDIRYGYSDFWFSYRLTYETKEEIICSQPFNERFLACGLPLIDKVQKAEDVAYILHKKLGLRPEHFEERLKIIGGEYKKQEIDELPALKGKIPTGFVVFYSFNPPYKKEKLIKIPRDAWMVSSNYKTEEARNAVDNDLSTRWGSGAPQCPGMYFLIDLDGIYEISKIRFDLGGFMTDFPRGYTISVSEDNNLWTRIAQMDCVYGSLFWEGSHPWCFVHRDFFNAAFPPTKARYVKIAQTGQDPKYDWSIAEINVYGIL